MPSSEDQEAYDECEREAIAAGALEPQDWQERMAAGVLASNGESWEKTPAARARLQEWVAECLRRKGIESS